MRSIRISKKQMEKRIARFARLKPLPIQNASIPQKARDVVYARKLLSVIGLESETPTMGAAGMTMTLAVCPPGQGPGLHAHRRTYETFTVLQGEFEVSWNDDGAERARLRRFDTVSFPPGVCRAFRNVGRGQGILQVIITGGVHDMSDIAFSRKAKRRIEAVRPGLTRSFEKAGFRFDAAAR